MTQDRDRLISSLYKTYYKKMYQVGYRTTGNRELTLDLIQDTFLLAFFRSETLSKHPNQEGWLMKTLGNLIQNEKRRMVTQELSLDSLGPLAAPGAEGTLEELLPARLSLKDREILLWRYGQGMDYRDMADRLGISQSGCRDRVSRAVKRCRELLEETQTSG